MTPLPRCHATFGAPALIVETSGFVTFEVAGAWTAVDAVLAWPPERVSAWTGMEGLDGWMIGIWRLVLFPLIIWTILGAMSVFMGGATSIGEAWRRLALPMVVVIAAAHMAKGLEKLSTWAGYLPGALQDPGGVETALAISAGTLKAPGPILPHALYGAAGVTLVLAGLWFALRESKLSSPASSKTRIVQLTLVGLALASCVAGWAVR